MDDVKWIRIKGNRAWHIAANAVMTRDGRSFFKTACGLEADVGVPAIDHRPGNQPTCENCFRDAGPE